MLLARAQWVGNLSEGALIAMKRSNLKFQPRTSTTSKTARQNIFEIA
jgi:hypothetical protein